ncbi:MAG: hypothetical protein WB816_05075 [Methylocystis sp.]
MNLVKRVLLVFAASWLAPVAASADMLSSLRGQSLGCGMDFFFFSPEGRLLWSDEQGAAKMTSASLTGADVIENGDDRLVVRIKPPSGGAGSATVAFIRKGKGYATVLDGADQDCDAASGKQMMIDNWHDVVRESVCGNDPTPECEKALVRLCGKPAAAACAHRHAAELKTISAHARGRRH